MINKNYFLILMLCLLIIPSINATSNYIISIRSSDKNIIAGQPVHVKVDIIGDGSCDKVLLYFINDGRIVFNHKEAILYSFNNDPTDLHKYEPNLMDISYINDSQLQKMSNVSVVSDTNLLHVLINERSIRYLRFEGELFTDNSMKGGTYNFKAAFICNKNNSLSIYEENIEYHVQYSWEKLQFVLPALFTLTGALIAALIGFFSSKWTDRRREKENQLKILNEKVVTPLYIILLTNQKIKNTNTKTNYLYLTNEDINDINNIFRNYAHIIPKLWTDEWLASLNKCDELRSSILNGKVMDLKLFNMVEKEYTNINKRNTTFKIES